MRRGLILGGEDASAFQSDINAQFFPGQLRWILHGCHLELVGADVDGIAFNGHSMGKAAMHGVKAQQMGIGFNRAQIIDSNDFNIGAA